MIKQNDQKRICIFLAFAFGISWATALVIYLTGGLENSPSFNLGGTPLSLAFVLLASVYMFGPAIANVLTRLLTHEGKATLMLKPNFEDGRWKFYLAAWLMPGILTIVGAILFFILFPKHFDPTFTMLREQLGVASGGTAINPWLIVILQTVQAILIAPLLNAVSTFGEEFGWRGYLQPKLTPLGARRAILITGVIWGVWHWPIILMGYNYGFDYFGAPFLGPLAMVWFTLILSALFGWLTLKAESVWPAVIAHGAINGIAAIGMIVVKDTPDPLLGPTPVGLVGGLGLTLAALLIFFLPSALKLKKE
jgi:membrane protease YdiL (CAAX protease family)